MSVSNFVNSAQAQASPLTTTEAKMTSLINGTNAYNYALNIENIGLNTTLSGYSFRSAGSKGANTTAVWTKDKLQAIGVTDAHLEPFNFTAWDLKTPPLFVIDRDGNDATTADQGIIESFEPEQLSWPTPEGGVLGQIVTLPLPAADDRSDIGNATYYDADTWSTTNLTGKILLVGREVRWNFMLNSVLNNMLRKQRPIAVIYTWWYDWMSWAPAYFLSSGGRPASVLGSYYWDYQISVGWVNYQDGLRIRQELGSSPLYAKVTINADIGQGPLYNVVGTLRGSVDPDKIVIISGHYDSVMSPGLCDNAAGTAGVIELARVFEQAAKDGLYVSPYSLVFIAFTGEELGLVGAVNYMKQHEAQLTSIVAVINLDCIGGKTLEITEAFGDDRGLNIEDVVKKASADLNVQLRIVEPGGSDEEAFRDPMATDDLFRLFWETSPGIKNMTRVKSSIDFESYPLFFTDTTDGGSRGWIHTPYDNSTTAQTQDWINASRLQSHLQVALLTTLRVLSTSVNPLLTEIYGATVASVGLLGAAVYFKREQFSRLLKRVGRNILLYMNMRDAVYVVVLIAVFAFMSFLFFTPRVARIEINVSGYPTPVDLLVFGAPFDLFGTVAPSTALPQSSDTSLGWSQSPPGSIVPFWSGIFLNIIVYAALAFVLVFSVERIKAELEYSRYPREDSL